MFLNFTRTTFRNLWRNKAHTLINVLSLSLGLVVFTIALLYVQSEITVNHSWPQAERVHRLLGETRDLPGFTNGIGNNVTTSRFRDVREYFSGQLEHSTRILQAAVSPADAEGQRTVPLNFVDADFAEIFQLESVQGSLQQALSSPGFIALEEEFAKTLGEKGVMGAHLRYRNQQNLEFNFEVGAIYRVPPHVSPGVVFNQLTLFDDSSWPMRQTTPNGTVAADPTTQVWARLQPGVVLADLNAMQAEYVQQRVTTYNDTLGKDRPVSEHLIFSWQPLLDIHFNPTIPIEQANPNSYGKEFRVATVAIVGLLVLLVGCSNSISLSLAAVLERRRETGIRKAVGAQQGDLARQYFGESVVVTLFACLPALAVLSQLPAMMSAFAGPLSSGLVMSWSGYLLLLVIGCVVGIINGIYPVAVLSSIKPQAVLKPGAYSSVGGKQGVRSLIVATQFCLALMLLIGTAVLYAQLAVTRGQPLGFNADNTMFLVADPQQIKSTGALVAELPKVAGVSSAIHLGRPPNANLPVNAISQKFQRKGEETLEAELVLNVASFGFFDFMSIPLVSGRVFDERFDAMEIQQNGSWELTNTDGDKTNRVVLSRLGAQALGFSPEEALDQMVYAMTNTRGADGKSRVVEIPHRVIGVVEDSMYSSLSRRPLPEAYRQVPGPSMQMVALRYDAKTDEVTRRIQETAQQVLGSAPMLTMSGEERLTNAFAQEQMESRLLLLCGALAMVLSCIGLYGLTAFTMKHRTKEVGVRKVLGSTVGALVLLFLWRFARPVLIASLIAAPVALYFALRWIQKFPYQLDIAWLLPICLATTAVVLVVALLTVSSITTRAAMTRPVRSLRYE